MENFNPNDYQGRTKRQVVNNYKSAFYNIVFGVICLVGYMIYKLIYAFI